MLKILLFLTLTGLESWENYLKKRVNWPRNLKSHWLYGCPSLHLRGWFLVWPSACQTWKMWWAPLAKLYNKNMTNLRGYIFVLHISEYLVVKITPKPRGIFKICVDFVISYVFDGKKIKIGAFVVVCCNLHLLVILRKFIIKKNGL